MVDSLMRLVIVISELLKGTYFFDFGYPKNIAFIKQVTQPFRF